MSENQQHETKTENTEIEKTSDIEIKHLAKAVHSLARAVEFSKGIDSSRQDHIEECFKCCELLIGDDVD